MKGVVEHWTHCLTAHASLQRRDLASARLLVSIGAPGSVTSTSRWLPSLGSLLTRPCIRQSHNLLSVQSNPLYSFTRNCPVLGWEFLMITREERRNSASLVWWGEVSGRTTIGPSAPYKRSKSGLVPHPVHVCQGRKLQVLITSSPCPVYQVSVEICSTNLSSINLPSINLPSINLPSINLPSINLPYINLPYINLPSVNIHT